MRKLILACLIAIQYGCASIMSVEEYAYRIESDPPGAPYSIIDRGGIKVAEGITPDTVRLASGQRFFRKQEYAINIGGEKGEGVQIKSLYDIENWYAGNLLFGWLVGFLIVDPASGAMYRPTRQIIDTSFVDKAVQTATITISKDGEQPLTEEEKEEIKASDDMYLSTY